MSNLQHDNSIHFTRPDNGWEALILNKADYYSKVNAILSDTYNSVSFIMMLTNTVNCEARRCYQENRQKKSFTNKLFLIINIFQFTFRDKNNLIIMYGLLNVHWLPCKFLVSILDLLTRNQFSVKNSLFYKAHCNKLSNSKNPSTLLSLL